MNERSTAQLDGPVVQSVRIAFTVLRMATALLALGWATGNMRPVPPGTQVVVLRFGAVVDVRQSGLVLAWPRPIDTVVFLPSAERQTVLKIEAPSARIAGIVDDMTPGDSAPDSAGLYITGDGGVVLLDASITWRIDDAAAYYVARDHVAPALRRAFLAAAIKVAARRQLDDFMAVRPERAADPAAQAARNAVRGEIVTEMNRSLAALTASGGGLGVAVTRADVTAWLPPAAKISFDAVLDATQRAEQGLATARTEAERQHQQAERNRDALLTSARAAAQERLARARTGTANIMALAQRMDPATRPSLLDQIYRERISAILNQAGATTTVDAKSVSRVIIPGATP
jgi:regulator of protease activity HflC (stomatin/prohibitin superfamily)